MDSTLLFFLLEHEVILYRRGSGKESHNEDILYCPRSKMYMSCETPDEIIQMAAGGSYERTSAKCVPKFETLDQFQDDKVRKWLHLTNTETLLKEYGMWPPQKPPKEAEDNAASGVGQSGISPRFHLPDSGGGTNNPPPQLGAGDPEWK